LLLSNQFNCHIRQAHLVFGPQTSGDRDARAEGGFQKPPLETTAMLLPLPVLGLVTIIVLLAVIMTKRSSEASGSGPASS
jgi:hypothetical protein